MEIREGSKTGSERRGAGRREKRGTPFFNEVYLTVYAAVRTTQLGRRQRREA